MSEANVVFDEPILLKIADYLALNCLMPADNNGELDWSLEVGANPQGYVGILQSNPNKKKIRHLFGLISYEKRQRKRFLGMIWFSDESRGANDKNWIFEMYGREHVDLVKKIAGEMSAKFDVKITVKLMSHMPRYEYMDDGLHAV